MKERDVSKIKKFAGKYDWCFYDNQGKLIEFICKIEDGGKLKSYSKGLEMGGKVAENNKEVIEKWLEQAREQERERVVEEIKEMAIDIRMTGGVTPETYSIVNSVRDVIVTILTKKGVEDE